MFCLAVVFFYLRLFRVYMASSYLGPKLFVINRMVTLFARLVGRNYLTAKYSKVAHFAETGDSSIGVSIGSSFDIKRSFLPV